MEGVSIEISDPTEHVGEACAVELRNEQVIKTETQEWSTIPVVTVGSDKWGNEDIPTIPSHQEHRCKLSIRSW